jgi:uncharacterized protein (UPF0261 family)
MKLTDLKAALPQLIKKPTQSLFMSRVVLGSMAAAALMLQPSIDEWNTTGRLSRKALSDAAKAVGLIAMTACWRYANDDTCHTPPWLPGRNADK